MTDIMERPEGMDFDEWKAERKKLNKAIKEYCKGKIVYLASVKTKKGKQTAKPFEGDTDNLK
jgi:hypothetical protein